MVWSIFKHVKKALDEEDIESLLAIGAPGDEYSGEASQIESLVAQKSEFGKENSIRTSWNKSFRMSGPASLDRFPKINRSKGNQHFGG
jgi:hypothetical protein